MKAIILAAGRGERMRPLTDTVPKPLLPVRGKPLIEWHLEALASDGIREVVINTAWLEDRIVDALGDGERFGLSIRYSLEGRDFGAALETAGGIATALPMLLSPRAGADPGVRSAVEPSGTRMQASFPIHGNEDAGKAASEVFWVVSGDIFMPGFTFDASAAEHFVASDRLAHLWLVPNPPYNQKGDFGLAADGTAVADGTGAEGLRWTYANIALMRPALLEGIVPGRRAALGPVLFDAARRGRISAQVYGGEWHNVGTPDQLASLQSLP